MVCDDELEKAFRCGACIGIADLLYTLGLGDGRPEAYRKARESLEAFGIDGPDDISKLFLDNEEYKGLALVIYDDESCWDLCRPLSIIYDPKGFLQRELRGSEAKSGTGVLA